MTEQQRPNVRLDRIEAKLDKISESITRLGIIEERIIHRDADMTRIHSEIAELFARLQKVEQRSWSQAPAIEWIKTLLLMVLSGALTVATTKADMVAVQPATEYRHEQ
jgi:hypothetical protein